MYCYLAFVFFTQILFLQMFFSSKNFFVNYPLDKMIHSSSINSFVTWLWSDRQKRRKKYNLLKNSEKKLFSKNRTIIFKPTRVFLTFLSYFFPLINRTKLRLVFVLSKLIWTEENQFLDSKADETSFWLIKNK